MSALFDFASKLDNSVKQFGTCQKPTNTYRISAGNLSMIYEGGSLRYIFLGNHEIVRMIYSAVRDRYWLTAKPEISNEFMEFRKDSFTIRYNCRYRLNEIDFLARYTMEGFGDNVVRFEMSGEALTSFYKNRIGFCVLHPVDDIAGKSCTLVHSDRSEEIIEFPGFISPHQPFKDITAMRWFCAQNIPAELKFTGEIFETEDQRNWTDASYKTYCTPLDLPFPVLINKGDKIRQSVELKVTVKEIRKEKKKTKVSVMISPGVNSAMPVIGIGRSTREKEIEEGEIDLLKNLCFDHYRTDIYLFDKNWSTKASMAEKESKKLGFPLELALFFDGNFGDEVNSFMEWVRVKEPVVAHINVFHKSIQSTPGELLASVIPGLRAVLPGTTIAAGTNANFAQLNRARPDMNWPELVTFAVHPQEHTSDNASLLENMAGIRYAVRSARQFSGNRSVWVSPVTLQRRFNANIENFEHEDESGECPPQVDHRIMSLFGAIWTLGAIKYLYESGTTGITFYETVGERGIMQGSGNSRWPLNFFSVRGMIFPVFHIFRFILQRKKYAVIPCVSDSPLSVEAFGIMNGNKISFILTNCGNRETKVKIGGLKMTARYRVMHEGNFATVVSEPDWYDKELEYTVSLPGTLELKPVSVYFFETGE